MKKDDNDAEEENGEFDRYSRHMLMPEIGLEGQKKMKDASVLIVGVGGLGCNCALHLALSGVGKIGLSDTDRVELTNIHRQTLHTETTIGMHKVDSAILRLREHCGSSYVQLVPHKIAFTPAISRAALEGIISQYDIVCDCTDSVDARYVLGDITGQIGIPLVAGDALAWDGHCTIYNWKEGPCLRCIHPIQPEKKFVRKSTEMGVFGSAVCVISSIQAIETIKLILGIPSLVQKLIIFDAKRMQFRNVALRGRNSECQICSARHKH